MAKGDDQHRLQTAFSLHQAGNLNEAANLYRQIIERDATNAGAIHFLGVIEGTVGNFEQAKSLLERSLKIQPSNIHYIENYATILLQVRDYESALKICEQGLQLSQSNVSLLYVSAVSLYELRQLQSSIRQFDKLLSLQPNHIEAINDRGAALAELKDYDAALASFEKTLSVDPRHAGAHLNKGNLFGLLKRYEEAFVAYDKALTLNPNLAEAWVGRGNILRELGRYDESFVAYAKALAIEPNLPDAWFGRGNAFMELKRYEEALAAFEKAQTLEPDLAMVEGARLYAKIHLCDWNNFDAECAHLISSIRSGIETAPFLTLAISSSPDVQHQCAKRFSKSNYPLFNESISDGRRFDHDRIRVAYLSADFGDYPMSHLLVGVFEQHNHRRFETIAISFGTGNQGEIGTRVRGSFDQFIDVRNQNDFDVAKLLKRLEVDIAVDLMGYTAHSRTAIVAHRPCAIQVNFLGYPGTMGADYIDYLIADQTLIPEFYQRFYTEKIVYLPHCYQANDAKRPISDRLFTRSEYGLLPEKAFVFCCFNGNYKILPPVFDCWMRVLKKIEGSVLWLLEDNVVATGNLRKEAAARGVSPDRLIFARRMPPPEHLARQQLADLFLDTLPCNAHTTASDALWAGLPVLTQIGNTFAGRVASSLLNAVGLPELITSTEEEYEKLAIDLAVTPDRLEAIKRTLSHNRLIEPLFRTELFTRHIEAAYTAMYERYKAGGSPDHIYVQH